MTAQFERMQKVHNESIKILTQRHIIMKYSNNRNKKILQASKKKNAKTGFWGQYGGKV